MCIRDSPNTKPEKLHDFELGFEKTFGNVSSVSYTHLDVYKRQF